MRYILLILLTVTTLFAESVSLEGLSPEQVAAVKQITNQRSTAVAVREETEAWVRIGQNVGTAMLGAAKEIGVAAVDFAKTPLGVFVCALIILKMFGTFIMGVLIGSALFTVAVVCLWYVSKRIMAQPEYTIKPVLWGLWSRRVVTGYKDRSCSISGEMTGFYYAVPTIIGIVGLAFIGVGVAHI